FRGVEAVVVRAAACAWAGWGEVLYSVEDGDREVAAQGGWARVFDADDVLVRRHRCVIAHYRSPAEHFAHRSRKNSRAPRMLVAYGVARGLPGKYKALLESPPLDNMPGQQEVGERLDGPCGKYLKGSFSVDVRPHFLYSVWAITSGPFRSSIASISQFE